MYLDKSKKIIMILVGVIVLGFLSYGYVKAGYLPTNRDTKPAPDKVTYDILKIDEFTLLYETDTLVYYFREDRDIFAIKDKRTGYTWKTGIDIPFGADINQAMIDAETPEEALELAIPQEDKMNTSYTGIANSLITVEYFEEGTIKNISSASKDLVESELKTLNDNPATRRLDVNFMNIELKLKVYITLGEDGITYEIKDEEITGKGKDILLAINITPFLGASGGRTKYYNPETQMYDIIEDKYMIPGYIFVPDGSGALIRFKNNTANFSMYYGDVYGEDPSQNTFHGEELSDTIPLKNPVMPVFGIAHGDGQGAFVAYADEGAEYMQIVVRPEENMTAYNFAYPRFVYNVNYFQVYNQQGDGFFTLMEEPNHVNIKMTYTFLAGDGSDGTPAADYTGMARTYREHLIDQGILTRKSFERGKDIPLRLDFIMADSKKSIVGTEEVVVTTVEDTREILNGVIEDGITNINSGLKGWQKNGESLSRPYKDTYSRKIGKKKDFKELITEFAEKGVDISQARDFVTINKEMFNYQSNAARHVNSWYLLLDKTWILPYNNPVHEFGYAIPKKSAEWFNKLFEKVAPYSESFTVGGISNTLLSHYNRDGVVMTVTEAIALYQEALENANKEVKLNLVNPNMYLWKYTDRYLQSPVITSQYVFETDTVPFLQMVLNGTMEVYAPYSNFSFYTQSDILRMIDYNLSPSFILSKEPSYHLASTSSADLYSTEFDQYQTRIVEVYSKVNEILSQVAGYEWTGRHVLDNGVILNSYHNGSEERQVLINYTDDTVTYEGNLIAPLSAELVIGQEVQ